jgi:hypothetical protein
MDVKVCCQIVFHAWTIIVQLCISTTFSVGFDVKTSGGKVKIEVPKARGAEGIGVTRKSRDLFFLLR